MSCPRAPDSAQHRKRVVMRCWSGAQESGAWTNACARSSLWP